MTTGPQNAVPFGKYLLLKRLAVGGMAELYLAKDPQNDRLVVIKRILPYLAQETEFVRMFLDEARIAAQLHHPHIIRMHELGHLEGSIFIAMEFVEGVDLRKILQQELKRQMFVPTDIAAWLTARLCEGLHYAHNRSSADGKPLGIIHRDVSPQNLMVGFGGEVKLVDFGIAKANSFMERSKPGVIKGKFLYLSPEQLSQERIDHRADIFAVGTMLYEVTTGKSPFYKPTTEAVIYAIRAEDPPPPHLTMGGYPVELSRIVMRCLLKDRSKRYQQAGEVHADLEAWMRKESPTTMDTVVDYVDKLFGDQQERTSLFIPPNARGERTRLPTGSGQSPIGGRSNSSEEVPTSSGLSPIPVRTNSNPTVPLGPFKSIDEETTKPIASGLQERVTTEGRRPTPAPDSVRAVQPDELRRTQPARLAETARQSQKKLSVVTTPETRAITQRSSGSQPPPIDNEHTANTSPLAMGARNVAELEATAISHAGRLHTGDSLVELTPDVGTPSAPTPAPSQSQQAITAASPALKRSRDFPQAPPRASPSYLPPAPSTSDQRPSNFRQPSTDPSSSPLPAGPSDTFADDEVNSYDPSDEESTIDFRDSALSNLKQHLQRDSQHLVAIADGLLTRKPWLIAVFAFLAVLVLGLILIISTRPDRRVPLPGSPHATIDPVTGDLVLPEAPSSDLPEAGKTVVKFAAPAGTLIVHDGTLFQPNKAYPIFPGSFTLMYQCPKTGKTRSDSVNESINVDPYRSEPQVIPITCH